MTRVPSVAGLALLSLMLAGAGAAVHSQGVEREGPPPVAYVAAERLWSDTGVFVNKGDELRFCATGEIHFGPNATSGAGGVGDLQLSLPVRTLPIGALIGLVDRSTFPIGARTTMIKMPASGELFLGVNDYSFIDNSGSFLVHISRTPGRFAKDCSAL